jgi:hypothetical protein
MSWRSHFDFYLSFKIRSILNFLGSALQVGFRIKFHYASKFACDYSIRLVEIWKSKQLTHHSLLSLVLYCITLHKYANTREKETILQLIWKKDVLVWKNGSHLVFVFNIFFFKQQRTKIFKHVKSLKMS